MDPNKFEKKTHTTSRGMTYTYYVSKHVSPVGNMTSDNDNKALPTLLLQHGWPDHAAMWSGIENHLIAAGLPNRILVPDMLGYDGTSKPTDPAAYRWDRMSQDTLEILDAECVTTCISVGHDQGSAAAQRLYNYHPDRVVGLVMLNVPYTVPSGQEFDLDAVNALMTRQFGYPRLAYWSLFADPVEGPRVLNAHVPRVYSAMHATGSTTMRDLFCVPDAIKSYLLSDTDELPARPYALDPVFRTAFIDRMTRDGFDAPQQYYVAKAGGTWQAEAEAAIKPEQVRVGVPALYIGASDDAVCRPEGMGAAKQQGFLPDLEEHMVEGVGHWSPYEAPGEVARIMKMWLDGKGFTNTTTTTTTTTMKAS